MISSIKNKREKKLDRPCTNLKCEILKRREKKYAKR